MYNASLVSDPADLGVVECAEQLSRRRLPSGELVTACLARIDERDGSHSFDGDAGSILGTFAPSA